MSRCHDLVMSRNHEIMESLEIMSRMAILEKHDFCNISILACLVISEISENPRISPSNGILEKGPFLGVFLG